MSLLGDQVPPNAPCRYDRVCHATTAAHRSIPCPWQVGLWPLATEVHVRSHVGDRGKSGLVVLNVRFVARDPERTSRRFGLGADIKNFAPELRSNNSNGLRSGVACWWVASPHQCVTTMKSVSFPVSWLNPLSEIINEEAGVRSLEILSTVS